MARGERAIGRFFENDDLPPLDNAQPAGPQIFEALKIAILRMDIAPGSLIPETTIAERFNASRTPVREALARLRESGLVVTSAGKGNFATKLKASEIKEAQFVRQTLETGVVATLCEKGIDDQIRHELESNLSEQASNLSVENTLTFQFLDDEFHRLLAEATGFKRIAMILEREKMVLDRLRVLSLNDEEHVRLLFDEHKAIFQAVVDSDKDEATRMIQQHLKSVLDTLSTLTERHRNFFE